VIPALKRLRQEDSKFKASLSYIARPCLKQTNKQKNQDTSHVLALWLSGKACA
jgi:hypothetical protein